MSPMASPPVPGSGSSPSSYYTVNSGKRLLVLFFIYSLGPGTGNQPPTAASYPGSPQEMIHVRDGTAGKALVRSRDDRMLAGVCAGVAGYFGLDVTLVRVIWAVVAVLTGGAGMLAYLAAWMIIPDEGDKASIAEDLLSKKQNA